MEISTANRGYPHPYQNVTRTDRGYSHFLKLSAWFRLGLDDRLHDGGHIPKVKG